MVAFLRPARWSEPPSYPVEVDPTRPYADSLRFAMFAGPQGPYNIVNQLRYSMTTGSLGVGYGGLCFQDSSGIVMTRTERTQFFNSFDDGNTSLIIKARLRSTGDNRWFMRARGTGDTIGIQFLKIHLNSTTGQFAVANNFSGSTTSHTTTHEPNGRPVLIGFAINNNLNTMETYFEGLRKETSAITAGTIGATADTAIDVQIGNNAIQEFYHAFWFMEALPPAAMTEYSRFPGQLVRPIVARSYYFNVTDPAPPPEPGEGTPIHQFISMRAV
jgi:hypothetical protein